MSRATLNIAALAVTVAAVTAAVELPVARALAPRSAPAPAPAVYVPVAFCPVGLRVVPTPYLAREPANSPLCEGGSK
jgi:hypothetical protein